MIKFNSFFKIIFLVISFVLAFSLYKSWMRSESMRPIQQSHARLVQSNVIINDEAVQILTTKMKEVTDHSASIMKELDQAKDRIRSLEESLESFQQRVPKKFPDVKFLNYRTKKRVLVTGGAGFVGSHLVDRLMLSGHEVIVVDNFFTGRKRNVEQWIGHANFELIHQDIVNPLFIEVDEIYHLASPASPPHYMFNPVKTIKTNTIGTINMLGLAKRDTARILIASTSEIYGDPQKHPQEETYWGYVNPIGPRACYDEGKRVSETLSYAYAKQEQVDVRVARIFNTYGPRMHMSDGRVVSNFILQALRNETITVYGHGNQTRSFQYVSDLVDGLLALMESNYTQPVNIGNPNEHTIQEFAEIIKRLVGGNNDIKQIKAVEDDPQRRKPDITRAKTYLKWNPKVPLEEGLKTTIAYFKDELKISLKGQSHMDSAWIDMNEVQHHMPKVFARPDDTNVNDIISLKKENDHLRNMLAEKDRQSLKIEGQLEKVEKQLKEKDELTRNLTAKLTKANMKKRQIETEQ